MKFFEDNRFKVISFTVLVVLNLFLLGILWFRPVHPPLFPPPPHEIIRPPGIIDIMEKELLLNDEQKKLFNEIRIGHLNYSKTLMEDIRRMKKDILEEAFKNSPDTAKVNLLTKEIGRRQAAFEEYLFFHIKQLKEVCTPEQQKKLEKLFEEVINRNILPEPPPPARR